MRRGLIWAPLVLFVLLVATVTLGLVRPGDRIISSKMIGKPLPGFILPAAVAERPGLASADFATGKPRLLNFFASWCVPCAAEAPQLLALKQAGVEIDAIAIRDNRTDLNGFLVRWGNPYARVGSDADSRVQIALGSSGVPESFIIDGHGRIAYQHIGDIRAEDVPMILEKMRAVQ